LRRLKRMLLLSALGLTVLLLLWIRKPVILTVSGIEAILKARRVAASVPPEKARIVIFGDASKRIAKRRAQRSGPSKT
jgi:hypothetical protein